MQTRKLNSFLVIALILFSSFPVQAAAPTKYYEIDSDVELRGAIFVDVEPSSFYGSYNDGIIKLESSVHFENVQVRFKGTALESRLKKYNGLNVGYTHISDDGTATNEVRGLEIDLQGFAYIVTDFSTVIINGMTGTTTQTYTAQSANQSFNVPDGSSYGLNVTNNQYGVWTAISDTGGNTSEFFKYTEVSLNHTGTLTDYQKLLNITYDSFMQVGFDDIRFNIWNGTAWVYMPYWIESKTDSSTADVWIQNDYADGYTVVRMYYGNNGLSSASNGSNVFELFDDFDDGSIDTSIWNTSESPTESGGVVTLDIDTEQLYSKTTYGIGYAIRTRAIITTSTGSPWFGFRDQGAVPTIEIIANIQTSGKLAGRGYESSSSFTPDLCNFNEWHIFDIARLTNIGIFRIDDGAANEVTLQITENSLPVEYRGYTSNEIKGDWILVRKYTETEPTYTISTPQTTPGTANITASITGDSNTQSYNTGQSSEFILTPTGTINNVNVNTTSTDYDITIITYWTDDTTLQSETAATGYAKQYINYTPEDYNVSADLNTTFIFDFGAQGYIGQATSTLNDVSKTTTRDGQDVNASVGELIAGTPYYWNVTVPYNNIFTLSEQSDQTAYIGIPKAFTDSAYSDPDGNPIASRLWNFGDSDTSSSSNPSHTYTSLGDLNANYTVTEDATTNSQTITKEFNVTVALQPVQNLITEKLDQTWIKFNWSDYSSADRVDIYKLDKSIPHTTETVTTDGIKDSCYDDCAHGFVFDTPNPVSDLNYETVYWLRDDIHLHGYADGYDADSHTQDDYFEVGIDILGDGLDGNDRLYELNEGGTVTSKRWSGTAWLPQTTNAIGVVVGAGNGGAIQYEIEIPISELTGFVNGITTKFFLERECKALTPTVHSFYPVGVDEDNSSTWGSANITAIDVYNLIENTTISEYNSTGLTHYTWYKHMFVNVNGTTNSSAVYSTDITIDFPHYTVSGYVLDSITGDGIAGANVWAQNGFIGEITQTDANGFYAGYNFEIGNYSIYANVSAYAENFTFVNVTGNMTNINITMSAFEMTDWVLWDKLITIEAQNQNTSDQLVLLVSDTTTIKSNLAVLQLMCVLNFILIIAIWRRKDQ